MIRFCHDSASPGGNMARTLDITRPIDTPAIMESIRNESNPRLKERLQSLLWFSRGDDCLTISDRLGRCRQVVSNYLKTYDRTGLSGLREIGRGPGRRSQLTPTNKKAIRKWVLESPRKMGLSFNSWDCKLISYQIHKQYGFKLSSEQVRRMLHKMGFRLLRPRHKLLQANPQLISKKNARFKGLWLPMERIEGLSSSMKTR